MSEQDSFIRDVSESVRRDRLYRLLRRYGWIAALAVVLVVAGAAWNEWRQSRATAAAQAFGSAIFAALEDGDAAAQAEALGEIEAAATPSQRAMLAMIRAGLAAEGVGEADAALDQLAAVGGNADLPPAWRDLAALKRVLLAGPELPVAEKRRVLDGLAVPGAPYRLLALEQLAMVDVEAGDTDAALATLQQILSDEATGQNLRRRASQMIVALGGDVAGTTAGDALVGQ